MGQLATGALEPLDGRHGPIVPDAAIGVTRRGRASGALDAHPELPGRASTTSRTGATEPDGASCAACSARRSLAPARATAAHGAAIWGSAAVTLPALDIAPPFIFWGNQEVAIDLLHHTVYAVATGVAYEAITAGRRAS
jgi:hypothetical protein